MAAIKKQQNKINNTVADINTIAAKRAARVMIRQLRRLANQEYETNGPGESGTQTKADFVSWYIQQYTGSNQMQDFTTILSTEIDIAKVGGQ